MAAPGASVGFQAALSQHLGKPGHPSCPGTPGPRLWGSELRALRHRTCHLRLVNHDRLFTRSFF
jgi:hypothetical protein